MKGYALFRYGESINPSKWSPTISSLRMEAKLGFSVTWDGDKDEPFPQSGKEKRKVGQTGMKGNLSSGQHGSLCVPLHPFDDHLSPAAERVARFP